MSLDPDYRAVRRPLKRLRVARYTNRAGRHEHKIGVPIPAWLWRFMVRHGAWRNPQEIMADQCIAEKAAWTGTSTRVDYWAATEAPKTEAA